MKFEWDTNKRKQNAIKHGVSFKEAESVFDDENAIRLPDEERFVIIGLSIYSRELFVCYCLRGRDESIIRIISARKAEPEEVELYELYKEGLL
ncbi:MAG: BrnT family toxin [Defluviitaleaceae bacterium]|nr:BrnT family toxin [Defluviitaleaceae bacterium]